MRVNFPSFPLASHVDSADGYPMWVDTLKPKVDVNDGLVQISLVHYNTIEEVDRHIEVFGEALGT